MLWVHDKFENGPVRFVRSTSPSRSLSMPDMSGSSSLLGRCGLSGLTNLFELSSSSDPYVSSSHSVCQGSSDPPDLSGSSGPLDPFVLSGWSNMSGSSSQPNLSWLSSLLGPFGVESRVWGWVRRISNFTFF